MNATFVRLAVIIPVFNDAQNLRTCLASLTLAAQGQDIPILVVDDGSEDDSCRLAAAEYAVTYVRQPQNLGQSAARNRGVAQLESEYVLFIDSDVEVFPDCFTHVLAFINTPKPPDLAGMHGIFSLRHCFITWSSLIYNTLQHLVTRTPRVGHNVNTSFFLINRKVLLQVGGFAENLWFLEDTELAQRLAQQGWCIQQGPVEFMHRKCVTWHWLIRSLILGGKSQRHLHKNGMPAAGSTSGQPRYQQNRSIQRWFCIGSVAVMVVAILLASRLPTTVVGVAAAAVLLLAAVTLNTEVRSLCQVNRNPVFVGVGVLFLLLIPWLILFGFALGFMAPSSQVERQLWRKASRSPKV